MAARRFAVALAFAALALSASSALGDSWLPYGKRRVPDPTGRWYAVLEGVKYGSGGVTFSFAEARPGSAPVTAQATKAFEEGPDDFGVREGDSVLATGKLTSAPLEVRVSSLGLGFAAMEEYGAVGHGDSFVWVGSDGVARHVKRLTDLFSKEEIAKFTETVSSVWWFQAAWIDEEAREVVIVGTGGVMRAVAIESGKVRKAGDAEIRRAIENPDPLACVPALDLAILRKLEGLGEAFGRLLASAKAPLAVRLRAAVALAAAGDRRGADLVRRAAARPRPDDVPKEDREYAIRHLPDLLGEAALPLLRDALRGTADEGWSAAQLAFATLEEKAVPTLVSMLGEAGASNDYRGGAAHALGKLGSRTALPALLSAIADPEEYVANAAANAAIAIGAASISKELAALLDRATTQDGRLASYFGEVKEPASVGPLVRALDRSPKPGYPRDNLFDALRFQTGERLGNDAAAWKAWLAKRGG